MASAERRPIDLAEGWGAMQVRLRLHQDLFLRESKERELSLSLSLRAPSKEAADRRPWRAAGARAWPRLLHAPLFAVPAALAPARAARAGARKTLVFFFLTRHPLSLSLPQAHSPPLSSRGPPQTIRKTGGHRQAGAPARERRRGAVQRGAVHAALHVRRCENSP